MAHDGRSSAIEGPLCALLAARLSGFESLLGAEQLSSGASQESYRITVRTREGERRYCLRRVPGGERGVRMREKPSLATEANLMCLAGKAGVPEPRVILQLEAQDGLGEGFLMEWLDGETLGSRIVRAEELAGARGTLARDCGRILARIHAIDVDGARLRDALDTYSPREVVIESWERYQAMHVPQPMIDYTARWLLENEPKPVPPALVHGDFRNGNLIVGTDGIRAVLDWELAHLGDPMRDLGWLCTRSWRFGRNELAVGGFGTREQLFAGYAEVSGLTPDAARVRYWEIFGSWWWAVGCLQMAQYYRDGHDRSVERLAIGRRSSECQFDCVNLLIPGEAEALTPCSETPELGLPGSNELLESVRDFLRDELREALPQRFAYLCRVAANSLDIVQREMEMGAEAKRREQQRLRGILGHDATLHELRQDLAQGLRDGRIALDTPRLGEHLRYTVIDQLSIDQPSYSNSAPSLQNES